MSETSSFGQSYAVSISESKNDEGDQIDLDDASSFRRYCYHVATSKLFDLFVLFMIFLNTVTLAAQTFREAEINAGWQLSLIDTIFFSVYLFELFLKLYVWRIRYFKSGWNIFDVIIVVASSVDLLVTLVVSQVNTFDTKALAVLRIFRVVRALRALRVLRTIRFLRHLQIMVTTLLKSIPALGSIVMLIGLVLYIFAIVGKGLYGNVDPDRFGNIGRASFTLFQLITLDDWFYMFSDVANVHPSSQHILLFLFIFIVLETFIFINLFIAVIVDSLSRTQAAAQAEDEEEKQSTDEPENIQEQQPLEEKLDEQALAIEKYYGNREIPGKQLKLMGHYCALLATLEQNLHRDEIQHIALDDLVDLLDIAKQ
jgi:cation channel sperm-associated protein 1